MVSMLGIAFGQRNVLYLTIASQRGESALCSVAVHCRRLSKQNINTTFYIPSMVLTQQQGRASPSK